MSKHSTFPDLVHFEHLARALWRAPGAGRAAVMVGAGMSLNARPYDPSARPMLTWSQLSERLVEAMYPPNGAESAARTKAVAALSSPGGFLRVAQEAEALLGRPALDSIIAEAVPDLDHEPGELHGMLMDLPWADVLTTNYDTLLERAARLVQARSYSVVTTAEDLGSSAPPRIVKLHGSLPSRRPFVLTEEDFRRYPSDNPAFVNFARQVILETSVCMIGFSGEDPNFLAWIGWVRDILGKDTRRLYLCGVLDLSSAQRLLFARWGIVPVDLSPVFPEAEWPEDRRRRAAAIEWLLHALADRQPPDPLAWPRSGAPPERPLGRGLPPLPPRPPGRIAPEDERP